MLRLIAAFALVFSIGACGKDSKKSDDAKGPETDVAVDATDYSICEGPAQFMSVDQATWHNLQRNKSGFEVFTTVTFFGNFMRIEANCGQAGKSISAMVEVPVLIQGNSIEILEGAEDHQELNENGVEISCSVGPSKDVYTASFEGRCLKLVSPSMTLTMPALER